MSLLFETVLLCSQAGLELRKCVLLEAPERWDIDGYEPPHFAYIFKFVLAVL